MTKTVPPTFGARSFTCPHCHALADQRWYSVGIEYMKDPPSIFPEERLKDVLRIEVNEGRGDGGLAQWCRKALLNQPFAHKQGSGYTDVTLEFVQVSLCFSCNGFSIWRCGELVHPIHKLEVQANLDMPAGAAADFQEAAAIFDASPRGAAALLRLALQKVLIHLGLPGENINADIKALVVKGLPTQIQQALDVVRVVGNNAVHPGTMDISDNRETALRLFSLLNIITDAMITQPRLIAEMFGELPDGARDAIARRDAPKAIAAPKAT